MTTTHTPRTDALPTWKCTICGCIKHKEEEVICWNCGKGEMIYQRPTTDTPRTDACPHCGCPLANCEVEYMSCFPCMSKNKSAQKNPRTNSIWHNWWPTRSAEVEHIKKLLKDIPTVHINTLRGNIATLSWDAYEHIIGPHPCRERAEKAEAEVERLKAKLSRTIEIADEFWKNQKQAVLVYHQELADELDQIKKRICGD